MLVVLEICSKEFTIVFIDQKFVSINITENIEIFMIYSLLNGVIQGETLMILKKNLYIG